VVVVKSTRNAVVDYMTLKAKIRLATYLRMNKSGMR